VIPVPYRLRRLQVLSNAYATLMDWFIEPVGISGTDAASPADHNTVDGTRYHRLVEDLYHLDAHTERSELPQEIKPADPLFICSVHVGPPFQLDVQEHNKELVVLHSFNLITHDVNGIDLRAVSISHHLLGPGDS